MKVYKKRIADDMLRLKLEALGAVLIEGPKACGKTTTAEQQAKSIVYMDDIEKKEQYRWLVENNIHKILEGNTPRLIDEWQTAPQLWDAIRFTVDHRDEDGQFILTGSAVPIDSDKIEHSGAGRFARLKMRPMSLWESEESNGSVSLKQLFDGDRHIEGFNELDLPALAFALCRGGWPKSITKKSKDAALIQVEEYVETIAQTDISRVDGINRDRERTLRLMRSYARHQGAQASIGTIVADMKANDSEASNEVTISSYINALRKIFVIEDMPAWNPNIRSKTAIRTSETRYYVDPSIAAAALGIGPNDLINDLNTFGLLFETLCIRDLRCYADALRGNVYHYRDKSGLECDAVIHLRNSSYGLIEIKLGGETLIDEGIKTLTKLESIIDTTRMNIPSFKMILTATGTYVYQKQGVWIVPIGCLRP